MTFISAFMINRFREDAFRSCRASWNQRGLLYPETDSLLAIYKSEYQISERRSRLIQLVDLMECNLTYNFFFLIERNDSSTCPWVQRAVLRRREMLADVTGGLLYPRESRFLRTRYVIGCTK